MGENKFGKDKGLVSRNMSMTTMTETQGRTAIFRIMVMVTTGTMFNVCKNQRTMICAIVHMGIISTGKKNHAQKIYGQY